MVIIILFYIYSCSFIHRTDLEEQINHKTIFKRNIIVKFLLLDLCFSRQHCDLYSGMPKNWHAKENRNRSK